MLAELQPPENLDYSNAIWHYVRGTAFASQKEVAAAKAERAALALLQDSAKVHFLDTVDYPASQLLLIADQLLLGEISMAEGKLDAAVYHFQTAVSTQDQLPYTEPPFWYYPTRQTLGKALLVAGNASAAEEVYRKDLENYPRNGWSLFGLIQSLKAQGKNIHQVQARFDAVWADADVELTASHF